MGEDWKQKRAKSFTQQQCFAYERELKAATLFSRTTRAMERTYSCTAETPVADLVGARVFLKPQDGSVAVIYGNTKIGKVSREDCGDVIQTIESEPQCPGMALAVIDEAAGIAGEFSVRFADHRVEE